MLIRRVGPLASATLAAFVTLSLVFYPEQALEAAQEGMDVFFKIVFPSLLPFFVLSDLMLAMGVVHFIGVLFEPLMRPVFNVPGEGAFALSMGLAAGYPMDAVLTARFRRQGLCTRVEGERLLAFTNTADPLFIFGAVAVGMFAAPWLGKTLAVAHYLGALAVGLIFRFYGLKSPNTPPRVATDEHLLVRATRALVRARREDGRALGKILGDAISESVKTLLMILGYIMLLSTIIKIIGAIGLESLLLTPLSLIFQLLGLDVSLVKAAFTGIFEIDLGALAAAGADAPFVQRAAVASAVMAWSGLSVHGQVASVLSGTDIRMGPYAIARLLHAVFSGLFTFLFWPTEASPTFVGPRSLPVASFAGPDLISHLEHGLAWALLLPALLALAGAVVALARGGFRLSGFRFTR